MTTNLTKYRETLTSPELKKRFESNNTDEKNLKLSSGCFCYKLYTHTLNSKD